MEKLTTRWPDCTQDTSCHSSKNRLQRDGNKCTLEVKINCTLKLPRWCWSGHWRPVWRWLLEMAALFLRAASPLPRSRPLRCFLSIKALAPWSPVEAELAFGHVSGTQPRPARIWKKVNFPFHQPGLFIGFSAVSSLIPHALSVTRRSGFSSFSGFQTNIKCLMVSGVD